MITFFYGRISNGFDFLGYRITPESADGMDVARLTINNRFGKIARLYERDAGIERIGQYVKGWWQWVNAGVDVIVQKAEELGEQKWDEQHGGIKRYMTKSICGVNSIAETARAITEIYAPGLKPARSGFVDLAGGVRLFTPVVDRVAKVIGFYRSELLSAGSRAHEVQARSLVCFWASRGVGMGMIQLSKRLKISQPPASQTATRGERIAKEN